MFPEILSRSIIAPLTKYFDPERSGWAIEIGVGTDNFYSQNFRQVNLKCIAVDPIPYPPFIDLAKKDNINFEEVCIYDIEGEITIFSNELTDLSSINQDWWGVDKKNAKKVKSILFSSLIKKYDIQKLTFLKIDTEGTEYEIIKQLKDLPLGVLPKIIEFEYGGGALRETNNGGWNEKYFGKVLAIFDVLKKLGYEQGLLLDSNDISTPFFLLSELEDPAKLFKPHYEYGNILIFKEQIRDTEKIEFTLLKAQNKALKDRLDILRDENTLLYTKIVKKNYIKRIANKLKRVFKF